MDLAKLGVSGLDMARVVGRLGAKKIEDLNGTDISGLAGIFKQSITAEEGDGILAFLKAQPSTAGETAVQWLIGAAQRGELDFLKPGMSASQSNDFGEYDYTTRCPRCLNPELVDLREVKTTDMTVCPFCKTEHPIDN